MVYVSSSKQIVGYLYTAPFIPRWKRCQWCDNRGGV